MKKSQIKTLLFEEKIHFSDRSIFNEASIPREYVALQEDKKREAIGLLKLLCDVDLFERYSSLVCYKGIAIEAATKKTRFFDDIELYVSESEFKPFICDLYELGFYSSCNGLFLSGEQNSIIMRFDHDDYTNCRGIELTAGRIFSPCPFKQLNQCEAYGARFENLYGLHVRIASTTATLVHLLQALEGHVDNPRLRDIYELESFPDSEICKIVIDRHCEWVLNLGIEKANRSGLRKPKLTNIEIPWVSRFNYLKLRLYKIIGPMLLNLNPKNRLLRRIFDSNLSLLFFYKFKLGLFMQPLFVESAYKEKKSKAYFIRVFGEIPLLLFLIGPENENELGLIERDISTAESI